MKNDIRKDLKHLIGGAGVIILALVGIMILSPLSVQFNQDGLSRGNSWEKEVNTFIDCGQPEQALALIEELIETKSQDLPRLAYFDRFLPNERQSDVTNSRADIYDLQWERITILQALNRTQDLQESLRSYVNIIGYNQQAAKDMLKQLTID